MLLTKDVIDVITERRTVREFKPDQIPRATISRIVEAGTKAPSAGNAQPWHFYAVFRQEVKAAIADACSGEGSIAQAPVVIVVCAVPGLSEAKYGPRGRQLYCIQDTAAAIENMLLACTGYGIGACWTGDFDEARVRQALGADSSRLPVAVIPMGYPADDPKPDEMRPFEQVVTSIV